MISDKNCKKKTFQFQLPLVYLSTIYLVPVVLRYVFPYVNELEPDLSTRGRWEETSSYVAILGKSSCNVW